MGALREYLERGLETWRELSPGHRIIMVLLMLVCIGSIVVLVAWQGQNQQRILFSGLSSEECAEVAKTLESSGIPASMSADGTGIMVPESRMQEARMVVAQEGMPNQSGKGLKVFQKPKLGMTPFAEKVTFVDALQTELAATITTLEGVSKARVHLSLPERKVFTKQEEKATASVLVVTQQGEGLGNKEVAGITNLVGSAVNSLSSQDVTVTDAQGNVLTGDKGPQGSIQAGGQWDYRQRIEQDLAQNAKKMLTRVLGPGQAEVKVSAELEFVNQTTRKESLDGDNKVLVSEQIESEESTGGGGRVGGVPGKEGQGGGQAAGGAGESSSSENINTEYMVGKSVTETVDRGARIKRLSVAAFVDTASKKDGKKKALDTEQIRKVIAEAVGYQESRGDSLEVMEADFPDPVGADAIDDGGMVPRWVFPLARYGAVVVVALICLMIARWALSGPELQEVPQMELDLLPDGKEAEGGKTREELAWEQVVQMVDERPEESGRLLEAWIRSEE